MNDKAAEIWRRSWPPKLHRDEYAKKRIESAKSAKLTPVKVDKDDLYAYFQGRHGRYETFLDECPCGDFRRSKRPCKHIYRLAMELGLLDVKFSSDDGQIPIPQAEKVDLSDVVDLIEELTEEQQALLLEIATGCDSPDREAIVKESPELSSLLDVGLVVYSSGNNGILKYGSVAALKNVLSERGLSFDPKMKAAELKTFCTENYFKELSDVYPIYRAVMIPPNISSRHVHQYLHRKYGTEYYFDPYSKTERHVPLLDTSLPQDAVTAQLIRKGYYKLDQ